MDHISRYPNDASSTKHTRNPFKWIIRSKYPFRNYHYMFEYQKTSNGKVVIGEIYFDKDLTGVQRNSGFERNLMYKVRKTGSQKYDKAINKEQITQLQNSWEVGRPQSHVDTVHIAVNGMQNDLTKATWLMGAHTEAAYPKDEIRAYTLFHNPTDGTRRDLLESVFDKRLGKKSQNAQHLAAILRQQQQKGQVTKWVVHSQGAIIFCAALDEYKKSYGKESLNKQQVAIHGSGSNLDRLRKLARSLDITVNRIANNPFDLVPNIAGRNNLSPSSLKRSLGFRGLVFGDDPGASPHTLPYLGIETYKTQLQMLGYDKQALTVQKHIDKYTNS